MHLIILLNGFLLSISRLEILFRIANVISSLSENSRKLDKFLTNAEDSLELSQDNKSLSFEEIQEKINYIQVLKLFCFLYL